MKTIITILFLTVGVGMNAQQQPSLVNVTGEGIVKVVPDQVVLEARVEHSGTNAEEVKKRNDATIDEVLKYLRSAGVDRKDVQTSFVNLYKNRDYQSNREEYISNQTLSIRIRNINRYEAIVKGLLETGINGINGIEFKSSEIEKHKQEARRLAVLDARSKAQEYARVLGQEIGTAYQINENRSDQYQPIFRAEAMKMDSSAGQESIATGEMKVHVKVNVAFHLR